MSLRFVFRAYFAVLVGLLGPIDAFCANQHEHVFREKDAQRFLIPYENYLNNLSSLQADAQETVTSRGPTKISMGKLYLKRPKGLKINYEPPKFTHSSVFPKEILVDGKNLWYHEPKTKVKNKIPLTRFPFYFLLKPKISLTKDLTLLSIRKNKTKPGDTFITLSFLLKSDPKKWKVQLKFLESPSGRGFSLDGWSIEDRVQGGTVTIKLLNLRHNQPIPPGIFTLSESCPKN